jgi:hypothetical protein
MFRAPLCPSSGARQYYIEGWCLWYLSDLRDARSPQTGRIALSSTPYWQLENQSTKYHLLYNTVELLMMVIMVPETCWGSSKICNKNHLLHLVGILFSPICLGIEKSVACARVHLRDLRLLGHRECRISKAYVHIVLIYAIIVFTIRFVECLRWISRDVSISLARCFCLSAHKKSKMLKGFSWNFQEASLNFADIFSFY